MAGQVLGVEGGEGALGALDALAQVLGVDVSRHVGGESGGKLAVQTLDPGPVPSLVQDQPAHTELRSIQDHFVKKRFHRVWSNRDMGLFSFWPTLSLSFNVQAKVASSEAKIAASKYVDLHPREV